MTDRPVGSTLAPGVWRLIAAAVLAVALILHALLPRYEFSRGPDSAAVFVFDRWTGVFQRVTYGANGEPQATPVVRPF
jgi:hypothetical protein